MEAASIIAQQDSTKTLLSENVFNAKASALLVKNFQTVTLAYKLLSNLFW
jgi:hypothetical protein